VNTIKPICVTIPCAFFVGRVKRQRNPTHLLGYGYRHTMANATLRERERTSIQPTNQDFFRFGQGIGVKKSKIPQTLFTIAYCLLPCHKDDFQC
jgi:hypothetical protein